MPAVYAHARFGQKVLALLNEDQKKIIKKYRKTYDVGLQGPDIFFFYRPYQKNKVSTYGNHLHEISAYPFFEHALQVVEQKGRDSAEFAYLLGFLCHFTLDSECHPYVNEMIRVSHVQHLEIEEEFEKKLLRMDGKDPFSYPLDTLIAADQKTAEAIAPFYEGMDVVTVQKSLEWMKRIKKLFYTPKQGKYTAINLAMKMTGKYAYLKGLMHQHQDNPNCFESNEGLLHRFDKAVFVAVNLIAEFDDALKQKKDLPKRLDRTFE